MHNAAMQTLAAEQLAAIALLNVTSYVRTFNVVI
jgi:hypothetical protein